MHGMYFFGVRGKASCQFYRGDSGAPDVGTAVVRRLCDHLVKGKAGKGKEGKGKEGKGKERKGKDKEGR